MAACHQRRRTPPTSERDFSSSSGSSLASPLARRDPGWTGGEDFAHLADDELKQHAKAALERGIRELSDAQELLWASDRYAVLVVPQAMDAAGKDSAIEHMMKGVNP